MSGVEKMKGWTQAALLVCGLALLFTSGCASKMLIESQPAGATVLLDGDRYVGQTPVEVRDLPRTGVRREYHFMMDGHHPRTVQVQSRMENRHICACFLTLGTTWPLLFFGSTPKSMVIEMQRAEPAPRAEFRPDPQVNFGPR